MLAGLDNGGYADGGADMFGHGPAIRNSSPAEYDAALKAFTERTRMPLRAVISRTYLLSDTTQCAQYQHDVKLLMTPSKKRARLLLNRPPLQFVTVPVPGYVAYLEWAEYDIVVDKFANTGGKEKDE